MSEQSIKKYQSNDVNLIQCLHNIRNLKPLNVEMMDYIRGMSEDDKMHIIETLNDVLTRIVYQILEEL